MRSGVRLVFLGLATGMLTRFGATSAWAETPPLLPPPEPAVQLAKPLETQAAAQPAPNAQPSKPAIPVDPARPSQVFPDGGFPPSPPVPTGAVPGPADQPGLGGLFAPIQRIGERYRPTSDYTPPGRIYRDPQPGVGVPLYQALPVLRPEQVPTDLERDKFVTRGLFPATYLIPGTNTSFKLYGFARLDGIFDFDPIGGTDSFVTAQIPVPQGRGQNFAANPRYSRLGLDTWTPTTLFDWTFRTRIEMDFFNGNNSGVFGSYPLRLRFAYIDFGPFRLGQAPSAFMDYDVYPNVLDYQGPNGMILMRHVIARVTLPVADKLHVAFAAEQPYSDIQWFEDGAPVVNPGSGVITTPGAPRNVQDMPDFTGHVRYDSDFGHLQVAGIVRKLTFQPAVGDDLNRLGSGVNLTGAFHPWAWWICSNPARKENRTALERSRFLGQYAVGHGINRYLQDPNGLGLDAVFDPVEGFRALSSVGWFLCYEHWWTEKWLSNFCYGEVFTSLPAAVPGNTYKEGQYLAVNVIWLPVARLGLGLEYLYGERENKDGQKGQAHRIQMGVQYSF
jgi:DcaP outer membrane protein